MSGVAEPSLGYTYHQFPGVFSAKQHAEPNWRALKSVENMSVLTKPPQLRLCRKPRLCFAIPVGIIRESETLYARAFSNEQAEIAHTV